MKKNVKFEDFELSESTKRALEDCGYVEATDIQANSIPYILEGGDIIGQSQTGTGKTASFGLPIVEMVEEDNRNVQALILCPTRELAVQTSEELKKFTKYKKGIKSLAVYGGQGIEKQIAPLKKGVQIVIGTPGRIMDHMRRKTLKLEHVKMVVLDEADEMLNMGFEEDIETILKDVPKERQTILFSATMNKRILNIASKYLNHPKNIKIKATELTVQNIEQTSIDMKQGMKDEALMRLLDAHRPKKAIVFCNTKRKVDDIVDLLKSKGYSTEGLHGDIKQVQRDRIMKKLKNGDFKILVATDVVARGIDIEDLELVINYDIPQEEEYYVHRIGRTGRNGNKGKAFTFVVGKERSKIYSIQKYAKTKIQTGKVPTVTEINQIKRKEMIKKIQEVIDKGDFKEQEAFEELINQNDNIEVVARALFSMLNNHTVKEPKKVKQNFSIDHEGNVRLFVNLGKKDKIMVKDIIGSVAANTAISGSDIGKVNILDKFSFVDVPSDYVEEVMSSMNGKQIKGRDVNIEVANG